MAFFVYPKGLPLIVNLSIVIMKKLIIILCGLCQLVLAQNTYAQGELWGMTSGGGTDGKGVIFKTNLDGTGYSVQLNFDATNVGSSPTGNLLQAANGKLYGMTAQGGANDFGTLFEYDPSSGVFTKKLDLGSIDGKYPRGGLFQASNGKIYGTTTKGGIYNNGILFEYDLSTGISVKKFNFGAFVTVPFFDPDGWSPNGDLVQAPNGKLYGTTSAGGLFVQGTIFEFDPITSIHKKRFNFGNTDPTGTLHNSGKFPLSGFVVGSNGLLYATVQSGGGPSDGVLFKFDPSVLSGGKIMNFSASSTGQFPMGRLIQANNGKLYGTTSSGGANNNGIIFEYDLSNSAFTKKFDFSASTSGANPLSSLAQSSNGKLYGITSAGGTNGKGVLFEFDPSSGDFTKKLDFAGLNGDSPGSCGIAFFLPPGSKSNQTITFNPLPAKAFGDAPFSLSATASSGLPVSYTSSDISVATIDGTLVTIQKPGTTTITASQIGNNNFNAAPTVQQTLTVNKADQTISFDPITTKAVGDPAFSLTEVSSAFLTITYGSSDPSLVLINNNIVSVLAGGTVTITASQAGNDYYKAATNVQRSFTITKADQTITFSPLPILTLGDAPFDLTATSSSDLTVTYSTTTNDKISIVNNKLTLLKAGQADITALQIGDASYNAAIPILQKFCVIPTKPSISLVFANGYKLVSSSANGNQWYFNGVSIGTGTNQSLDIANAGIYKLQVKIEGCVSEFSNEFSIDESLIITGDIKNYSITNSIEVFPSPVNDWLTISFGDIQGKKEIFIYQLDGRKKDSQSAFGEDTNFYVADYSSGIYMIKVLTENAVTVKRFVKQ
jgi:uncharacterized repeat protein (TIGR03803 family)